MGRACGLCAVGKFASSFHYLLRQVVADFSFIAGDSEIGGTQKLFFTIAQGVANGLLNLGIVDAALACGFASNQFENVNAVFQDDGLAHLAGLQA